MKPVLLTLLLVTPLAWAKESSAPANGDLDIARRLESAFVKVAEQTSPSVVVIRVTQKATAGMELPENGQQFEGTPFEFFFKKKGGVPMPPKERDSEGSGIIMRADGYILTNNHVVDDAEKIKVKTRDGKEFEAKVIGTDERTDVAVIKIEGKDLPAAKLGDSDAVKVGQWAIAIGAPYELDYSFTVGFVSAKGRSAVFSRTGSAYEDYIQTDASINPGNSGGPLCDIEGRVIGINTLIRGLNRGIGFAIPINMAKRIAEQLITAGKVVRPWLGIGIEALSENKDLQEIVGLKDGVVVKEIRPKTPAAGSDLRPADIIVAVDGVKVTTPRELQQQVLSKTIGQKIELEVMRDGKPVKVKVETAEMKDELLMAGNTIPGQPNVETAFGLTVQTLTKELARTIEIEATEGVVVTAVDEQSAAAEKGVREGDVIAEVNHKPVKTLADFKAAVGKADAKKGVLLYLKRGASSTFVVLKEK